MVEQILSYVSADTAYIFVAWCCFIALRHTDGPFWALEGSPVWVSVVLAAFWPVTLTTRVLKKLLG